MSNLPESLKGCQNIRDDRLRFLVAWLLVRFILAPLLYFYTRVLNKTEIYGLEHLEKLKGKTFLVCPNHTSGFDIWSAYEIGLLAAPFFSREYYLCGLGAVERLGNALMRSFAIHAGVLAVDRKLGLSQPALEDVDRLLKSGQKLACLIYPEGTRSRTGRLSRQYKAGAGWLAGTHRLPVLPVYQIGYNTLPGFGRRLQIHIGEPLQFEDMQQPESPSAWIEITRRIMGRLYQMEASLLPASNGSSFLKDYDARLAHAACLPPDFTDHKNLALRLAEDKIPFFWNAMQVKAMQPLPSLAEIMYLPDETQEDRMARVRLLVAGGVRHLLCRGYSSLSEELIFFRKRQGTTLMVRIGFADLAKAFVQPDGEPVVTDILLDAGAEGRNPLVQIPLLKSLLGPNQRLGVTGGVATPQAVKAIRAMGADFVISESIHLLFESSGLSPVVRKKLRESKLSDYGRAVTWDSFDTSTKAEVFTFGSLYPSLSARLLEYWQKSKRKEEATFPQNLERDPEKLDGILKNMNLRIEDSERRLVMGHLFSMAKEGFAPNPSPSAMIRAGSEIVAFTAATKNYSIKTSAEAIDFLEGELEEELEAEGRL